MMHELMLLPNCLSAAAKLEVRVYDFGVGIMRLTNSKILLGLSTPD
jgi:hypothetical protein